MKKIKIKSIKKKIFLFAIIISMILSTVPANALSLNKTTLTLDSGEKITLTKSQLDEVVTITQAEAEEVAMSFVNDMITAGTTDWDEQTTITSVVPMYDNSNTDEITAYTVNLDTGYVVVSAYIDVQSLIPEWSDKAAPLYKELDIDESDKVIYLGAYEYYADNGTAVVKGLYDEQVQKSELTNLIEDTRDLKHIPDIALKQYNDNERVQIANTIPLDPPITDPISHGNANYVGPFVFNNSVGHWDNYITYFTDAHLMYEDTDYYGHCVPIALTNIMSSYRNKYAPGNNITNLSYFRDIVEIGIEYGYYVNSQGEDGGTTKEHAHYYLGDVLLHYDVDASYIMFPKGEGLEDYDSFNYYLTQEKAIIYLELTKSMNNIYGNHGVVCFGFSRYRSTTTGSYLTYLHLSDGNNTGTRYITMASALTSYAVVVMFE